MSLAQTAHNSGFEGRKIGVGVGVQALLFDKLPQTLNQVEIGRVSGEKTEFNMQAGRGGHHQGTFLVTGIVQDERDGDAQVKVSQLMEELAHTLSGNVRGIGNRDEFMGNGIQRAQNIELCCLSAYSPNLNLIERLWKFVKKQCLYSHYYADFVSFKSAIRDCLSQTHSTHKANLDSLLSLRFQTFKKTQFVPA